MNEVEREEAMAGNQYTGGTMGIHAVGGSPYSLGIKEKQDPWKLE